MKKTLSILLVFLFVINAFSIAEQDFNNMLKVFRENARLMENDKGSQEQYFAMDRVEKEKERLINELSQDIEGMNLFIRYLNSMKTENILAFQDIVNELYGKVSSDIINNPDDPASRQKANAITSLMDIMRKYSKLNFDKKTEKEHPYVTLFRSLYDKSVNTASLPNQYKKKIQKGWATDFMIDVSKNWDKLSTATQKELMAIPRNAFLKGTPSTEEVSVADTEELPVTYSFRTKHFIIKYQKEGKNAVLNADKDEDLDEVPAYVEKVATYIEKAYKYEVEELGFKPAAMIPSMEVLITDMRDYGICIPIEDPNKEKCYMQIDNDYIGDNYQVKELQGAAVTCAHEFFHSIQARYGLFTNRFIQSRRWMAEGTAVWMEDAVFDDVNDYLTYVNGSKNQYFDEPQSPIFDLYPSESYTSILWFKFITESKKYNKYNGMHVLKALWEDVGKNEYSSIEAHLSVFGEDFNDAFRDFSIARYRTGIFEEHDLYTKELNFVSDSDKYPVSVEPYSIQLPQVFGANYIRFKAPTDKLSQNMRLKINFESEYDYPVALIVRTKRGYLGPVNITGKSWQRTLKRFGKRYREVVLVVYNVDRNNRGVPYKVNAEIVE
ncbi:MAG: hypothetical protein C0601_01805 [Candidatus Muiribacterium halophilum]|uniref:Uncharacterized protein n=1 Tax=Muiribacterium halophilum TaxID=2053465 RepID=A0A2N5ZL60_MUIH1|nr:MAG: hypothetical protein C0601_01805 [Candidatus Muirbacterium halophilum]